MFDNNIKNARKKNSQLLAGLYIDQKFYDEKLTEYDEDKMRKELNEAKINVDKEKQKIDGILKASGRKDKKPTEEELKGYNEANSKLKLIETEVNKFEKYRNGKKEGMDAISNVRRILEIIDEMSPAEKDRMNKL